MTKKLERNKTGWVYFQGKAIKVKYQTNPALRMGYPARVRAMNNRALFQLYYLSEIHKTEAECAVNALKDKMKEPREGGLLL